MNAAEGPVMKGGLTVESKFTPGPWKREKNYNTLWISAGKGKNRVEIATLALLDTVDGEDTDWVEVAANASLISACPDLLAACEEVLRTVDPLPTTTYRLLRDAIAKARGITS